MDLFTSADAREASQRRNDGMHLAALAEDLRGSSFSDEAFDAIKRVALRQQFLFVDDVLAECRTEPHHCNAWGAVWSRAIKAGFILRTKERKLSKDPKKHGHDYAVYRSLICKVPA